LAAGAVCALIPWGWTLLAGEAPCLELREQEAAVLADVRTIVSSMAAYLYYNGGFADGIPCLLKPHDCLISLPPDLPPFLEQDYTGLRLNSGYDVEFHPGKRADAHQIGPRMSQSSLRTYAITATPHDASSGLRAFCVDDRVDFCFRADGKRPRVKEGRCQPPCAPFK
jgi:hypothetical protein